MGDFQSDVWLTLRHEAEFEPERARESGFLGNKPGRALRLASGFSGEGTLHRRAEAPGVRSRLASTAVGWFSG